MITSQKGTRDLLPPETRVWNGVERTARDVFALYGYDEIRTPIFEATELFVRSVGETTDIVHKEMYTFSDKGGRSVTLRPENTAGVARAFVEHGLAHAGRPWKLYYVGPQFRYERPQKGRFREFRQIGAEVLGDPSPMADADLIVMLFDFLERLGFTGLSASLNSVGTEASRPKYVEALRAFFSSKAGLLGDDLRRLAENPLRLLDSKEPAVKMFLEMPDLPKMLDFLDPESSRHHKEVTTFLFESGIPFRIDHRLVRGLDYYTRTVFEVTAEGLGAQDALVGGGRYDRLVSDLGGPKTPAIGFAIGEDRLVEVLPEAFRRRALESACAVAVMPVGSPDMPDAREIAKNLRAAGIPVDLHSGHKGLGPALKSAEKAGAKWAILVGQEEKQRDRVVVKNMASRTQEEISRESLADFLRQRL